MVYPKECCETSRDTYEQNRELGSFAIVRGRDEVGHELLLRCGACGDEWKKRYSSQGDAVWTKSKDND